MTVDAGLLAQARELAQAGGTASLSAWVEEAVSRHVEHEKGLEAIDGFLAGYEAEFGPITDEDIAAAERWVTDHSVVVRAGRVAKPATGPGAAPTGAGTSTRAA